MSADIALVVSATGIVLLALSLWLVPRHRVWIGITLGAVGLIGMSFSTVWLSHLGPLTGALKEEVRNLGAELRSAKEENVTLKDQNKGLEKKNNLLATQTEQVKQIRIAQLRQMLQSGVATPYYQIEAGRDDEMIDGKKGTYLLIRLTEPTTQQLFIFPERRYIIEGTESAMRESASRLNFELLKDVIDLADGECFVRGGADVRPYETVDATVSIYEPIEYLPKSDAGRYGASTTLQRPNGTMSNEELPNLRADSFRAITKSVVACRDMKVLDNSPSKTTSASARTAELIVYVAW
jgi:hypothetical protein